MFSASGMYGFAANTEAEEVFFHAQDFHRLVPGGPLPVLGEQVDVEQVIEDWKRRPRARIVRRLQPQGLISGTIRSFDSKKGWGFILYGDGSQAFLHASEAMESWLPVIGSPVQFYLGCKGGKSRACWVRPAAVIGIVSY